MAGDKLEFDGIVAASRGNGMFLVEIVSDAPEEPKINVVCTLSGKIRQNNIRIIDGDKVKIEVGVYDMTRGRITYRSK